jgi:hypothetical protein
MQVNELIARLKELLPQVTPGEWQSSPRSDCSLVISATLDAFPESVVCDVWGDWDDRRNSEYIAMCNPVNLARLLEELDRQTAQRNYWKIECERADQKWRELEAEINHREGL